MNQTHGLWTACGVTDGHRKKDIERKGREFYLDPVLNDNVVSEGILGEDATATAAGLGGGEVGDEDSGKDEDGAGDLLVFNRTVCQ